MAFTGKLHEFNLLVAREIHAQDAKGQPVTLRGFHAVDEAKLTALPDAKVVELYRAGFLGLIYAHLVSLANVAKLERLLHQRS